MLSAIRSAVDSKAAAASTGDLLAQTAIMVDDLYKAASTTPAWDRALGLYLEASAGTLTTNLTAREFTVLYVVDNSFEPGNMQRPLELFGPGFGCAGFVYACPQECSLRLMGRDGVPPRDQLGQLNRYISEGRMVADRLVDSCMAARRHVVYLDTDADQGSLAPILARKDEPRVLTIFRNQAPVPDTNVEVFISQ